MNAEINALAQKVIEAREELKQREQKYGRRAASAADSRARKNKAEKALLEAVLKQAGAGK